MRLPSLSEVKKNVTTISQFKGLDQRLEPIGGSFSNMKNISCNNYPALSTRKARGTGSAITKPNGLLWKNGLFLVDGTTCKYNGNTIAGLTVADSQKNLVGMGAWVVIFPDKVAYNTSTGAIKQMEANYTQSASISFDLLSEDSVYCKITATGINNSFSDNDNVTIAGVTHSKAASLLNTSKVITDIGTGYIVVTAPIGDTYSSTDTVTVTRSSSSAVITARDIGSRFLAGDKIKMYGFNNSALNVDTTISSVTDGSITVPISISDGFTQEDTITIRRVGFTQASGITMQRKVPAMDYVCEHNNRLWGCSSTNHEIYASKLGEFWNWYNFEGISTDSYALTVGSDGDFTGCVSHGGYVIFFKENALHVMFGDKPSNYSLNTKTLPGVRSGCDRSLQVVNETLYYVGRNGIYSYDGGIPSKISEVIKDEVKDAVCCQYEGKLYVSCKMNNVQTLLVYDPSHGIWNKEDGETFKFASYGNGQLYYINQDNKSCTITGADTGVVDWFVESGDITEGMLEDKYIGKVLVNFWLEKGSEADVYFKYDEEPAFKKAGTVRSKRNTTYTLENIPHRCNKFRYRIEGKGQFKLLAIAWTVEGGSELNGSIQYQHRLF